MGVIVVGVGVEGYKGRRIAGADFVADVDRVHSEARSRAVTEVPLGDFDALLLCVPDEAKIELLTYLLGRGKHALVEKPLLAPDDSEIEALQTLARRNGAVCYTAYNHRFE